MKISFVDTPSPKELTLQDVPVGVPFRVKLVKPKPPGTPCVVFLRLQGGYAELDTGYVWVGTDFTNDHKKVVVELVEAELVVKS